MWQLLSACIKLRGNKYKNHILLVKFFSTDYGNFKSGTTQMGNAVRKNYHSLVSYQGFQAGMLTESGMDSGLYTWAFDPASLPSSSSFLKARAATAK
jgi:hypothetical protein